MLQANAFKNLQWKISEYSKENHGTIQLIGNIDMFRTLFAEMFIDRNDIEENPQVITQRYKALSERLHYTFTPSEGYLRNTIKWLAAQWETGSSSRSRGIVKTEGRENKQIKRFIFTRISQLANYDYLCTKYIIPCIPIILIFLPN